MLPFGLPFGFASGITSIGGLDFVLNLLGTPSGSSPSLFVPFLDVDLPLGSGTALIPVGYAGFDVDDDGCSTNPLESSCVVVDSFPYGWKYLFKDSGDIDGSDLTDPHSEDFSDSFKLAFNLSLIVCF